MIILGKLFTLLFLSTIPYWRKCMERHSNLWKNAEYNSLQTQHHEIEISAVHCERVMVTEAQLTNNK